MRVYVTGGSGFIGEHLINMLRLRGDPVRGLALTSVEIFWRLFRRHGEPPLSREILAFFFNPVSINDDKARRELGYRGRITTKQGLAELRKQNEGDFDA